jgi:hypothetical protein
MPVARPRMQSCLSRGVEFAGQDLTVQRGEVWGISQVAFTQQAYGPVPAVAWWEEDEKEPIYLVSNLSYVNEVCRWYAKRFHIETLFSDQKSCPSSTPHRRAQAWSHIHA